MENFETHSLGHRAFALFLSRRIKLALFLVLLTGVVWYVERFLPPDYLLWVDYAGHLLALVTAAYFIFILIITYFEYRRYTYSFTEEAFLMTHGYITRNEVAAMYHQIQSVNIRRTPLDRAVGVSQIVITLTGTDRESAHTHIILPAVGKTKAKLVQKELLVRARRHIPPRAPQ